MQSTSIFSSQAFRIVLSVLLLMFSAIVHEVAHGFVAYLCGDNTAKNAGRLTLNPVKHLDPFGSVILPLLMAFAGNAVFAYAKPVPYNPNNLRNRKRDEVFVALAGPASNLLQALAGTVLFKLWNSYLMANHDVLQIGISTFGESLPLLLLVIFSSYIWVNLMLCFFNLIPLPPLDGSKVLCYFLHGEALRKYYQIQQYAMPILIIALYILPRLGVDPVGAYLDVTCNTVYSWFMGV